MKILLVSMIAAALAQVLKPFFAYYKESWKLRNTKKKAVFNWKNGTANGGMPSSHSAFVSALVIQILLDEKDIWNSKIFAIACVFAMIVCWDAKSLRRGVGELGNIVNELGFASMKQFVKEKYQFKPLKVVLGHTNWQVFIGILLGLLIGWLGYNGFLGIK